MRAFKKSNPLDLCPTDSSYDQTSCSIASGQKRVLFRLDPFFCRLTGRLTTEFQRRQAHAQDVWAKAVTTAAARIKNFYEVGASKIFDQVNRIRGAARKPL